MRQVYFASLKDSSRLGLMVIPSSDDLVGQYSWLPADTVKFVVHRHESDRSAAWATRKRGNSPYSLLWVRSSVLSGPPRLNTNLHHQQQQQATAAGDTVRKC